MYLHEQETVAAAAQVLRAHARPMVGAHVV